MIIIFICLYSSPAIDLSHCLCVHSDENKCDLSLSSLRLFIINDARIGLFRPWISDVFHLALVVGCWQTWWHCCDLLQLFTNFLMCFSFSNCLFLFLFSLITTEFNGIQIMFIKSECWSYMINSTILRISWKNTAKLKSQTKKYTFSNWFNV